MVKRLDKGETPSIQKMSGHECVYFTHYWEFLRRADQYCSDVDWLIWLLLGGRGCGKTRTGAEWIRAQAKTKGRLALIAPTFNDAREAMLEGESGLMHIGLPSERPSFSPSRRRLDWPNGAVGYLFSSEDPDSLRGPQFNAAWADEFCAWTYPEETLSNLRFGLRLGETPKLVVTTTPKATAALQKLMKVPSLVMSRASTKDNKHNLSPAFLSAMEDAYGGTRLGRQELNGELILDHANALWCQDAFEKCRVTDRLPEFDKVIIAIDPPVTSGQRSDQCGLIVAARTAQGARSRAFILHDGTVQGISPEGWAKAALNLYEGWKADGLVVEVNQGGELVETVLRSINPNVPIRTVFARRNKDARAEPVANLYEQGRVFHVGRFDALEAELLTMGNAAKKKSPDRADALVWAVTHLLLNEGKTPNIRRL